MSVAQMKLLQLVSAIRRMCFDEPLELFQVVQELFKGYVQLLVD